MSLKSLYLPETRLFTFVVGNADMWYSAVAERSLYIRNEPEIGPMLRGASDCVTTDNEINLCETLLEFGMSCESGYTCYKASELVECTGRRAGSKFAKELFAATLNSTPDEQIITAFTLLFQSMECSYRIDTTSRSIEFNLDVCPFTKSAQKSGIFYGIELARLCFIGLCNGMLMVLEPQWHMTYPEVRCTQYPIRQIVICR